MCTLLDRAKIVVPKTTKIFGSGTRTGVTGLRRHIVVNVESGTWYRILLHLLERRTVRGRGWREQRRIGGGGVGDPDQRGAGSGAYYRTCTVVWYTLERR